jgi:hypothetical protein
LFPAIARQALDLVAATLADFQLLRLALDACEPRIQLREFCEQFGLMRPHFRAQPFLDVDEFPIDGTEARIAESWRF